MQPGVSLSLHDVRVCVYTITPRPFSSIRVHVATSGFLKMNQESLKTVGVSSFSIMAGEGKPVMTTGGTSIAAIVSHSRSPFLQSE